MGREAFSRQHSFIKIFVQEEDAHSTPKCIKRDEIAPGEGTMILCLNQKIEGIMYAKRLPTPDTRQKMPDLRI